MKDKLAGILETLKANKPLVTRIVGAAVGAVVGVVVAAVIATATDAVLDVDLDSDDPLALEAMGEDN